MISIIRPWEICHAFLLSADFFQNQLFRKILSGIPSGWQTVLLGLIWVCKSYQQTTLEDTYANTDRLNSQSLNSVIYWLINHSLYQHDIIFYDAIHHVKPF